MKRQHLGGLAALGLITGLALSTGRVGSEPALIYGDLTGDGQVTAADAIMALQITIGAVTPEDDTILKAGDVFPYPGVDDRKIGDGVVDVIDARRILQYAVGLIPEAEFRPVSPAVVAFARDVRPILQTSCESFLCHGGGPPKGGLRMTEGEEYDALVNVESLEAPGVVRIKPGDPDHSYLYAKITGKQAELGGEGDRMPAGELIRNPPPLSSDEIETIRKWIAEGAPNN